VEATDSDAPGQNSEVTYMLNSTSNFFIISAHSGEHFSWLSPSLLVLVLQSGSQQFLFLLGSEYSNCDCGLVLQEL